MPFTFETTPIEGLIIATPRVFQDDRGFFFETYKASEFKANGIMEDFVQDNQSYSTRNVVRGLHYQRDPSAQGKLVRCIDGAIWDVAVDIRENSPTYKQWFGLELTAENKKQLYIPIGFAHGFVALSEKAQICYKCTAEYDPSTEGGILWNDPAIGIDWPIDEKDALLSEKDS